MNSVQANEEQWQVLLGSHKVDWLGLRHYELTQHEFVALSIPVLKDKNLDFQVACAPCFTLRDMAMRHEQWIVTWRGELMHVVIIAYAKSWNITSMTVNPATTLWDWFKAYYLQSLWMPTVACGTVPRSQSCSPDCFCKRQSWVKEAKGTPIELVAWASRQILPRSTNNGKGAYMETCLEELPGLASYGWWGDAHPSVWTYWLVMHCVLMKLRSIHIISPKFHTNIKYYLWHL